jgi:hypothetical protein
VFFNTTAPQGDGPFGGVLKVEISHPSQSQAAQDMQQARFLAVLPRIRLHAQIVFRHLKCWDKKADAIAETLAISWMWYCQLAQRGTDAGQFPAALASFAARAAQAGRRLCGRERTRDAMSWVAHQQQDFAVISLAEPNGSASGAWKDALHDNTQSPVADQVCFRCDFPRWRNSRSSRDRRLIDDLMLGERTWDVARKHGLSPGRVSQLRREFHADWERFCGIATEPNQVSTPSSSC